MTNRMIYGAIGTLLSAAIFAAPVSTTTAPGTSSKGDALVIASVNDEAVTAGDLLNLFRDRHSGHASFLGGPVEAKSFLNIVIDDRLLLQEAYRLALDEEPEAVKALTEYTNQNASELLVKQEIEEKSKASKEEIEGAWKNLNVFLQARQIAVATRQEAEEIRAAIIRGADPDALARKCSGARSSRNGGNIMVMWGQFAPTWEAAVLPLQPGDISDVIETRDGFEVVVVVNRVDTTPPELKGVTEQIKSTLEERKRAQRQTDFSTYLWERYGANYSDADRSPLGLLAAVPAKPDTVLATWKDGGKLTIGETFNRDELRQIVSLPPVRAKYEIDQRIRATVNSPLSEFEARARKLEEDPALAAKIDQYREYLMRNMLFRDHIFAGLAVSDDKLLAYYEAHKSEFEEPVQYHVAQILVATEKEAKEIRTKLDGGAEFTAIVEKYSKDPVSAASGGDLGYVTADKVPQAFQEVLTMKAGGVTKPILNTTGAWHLIKLLDIKPKRIPEFSEIKDKVEKAATEAGRREAKLTWVSKLRAVAEITIDDAAIKQFVADHKNDGAAPPQHALQ